MMTIDANSFAASETVDRLNGLMNLLPDDINLEFYVKVANHAHTLLSMAEEDMPDLMLTVEDVNRFGRELVDELPHYESCQLNPTDYCICWKLEVEEWLEGT